jgi:hypothetical protein
MHSRAGSAEERRRSQNAGIDAWIYVKRTRRMNLIDRVNCLSVKYGNPLKKIIGLDFRSHL